jgi:NifB/MoaA-like Fe-S oxidoreductase
LACGEICVASLTISPAPHALNAEYYAQRVSGAINTRLGQSIAPTLSGVNRRAEILPSAMTTPKIEIQVRRT